MAAFLRWVLLSTATALAMSCVAMGANEDPPATKQIKPLQRVPETPPAKPMLPGESVAIARIPKALQAAVLADARVCLAGKRCLPYVKSARKVTWSDGSMGCPQPGMFYTQALVPGYLLVVSDDGDEVHYHTDTKRAFIRCDQALSPRAQREQANPSAAPPRPSDPVTRPKTPAT